MCCGAGGARMWMDETIGRRINIVRGRAGAAARSRRIIATACPYCSIMMSDGSPRSDRRTRSRRATSPSWSPAALAEKIPEGAPATA